MECTHTFAHTDARTHTHRAPLPGTESKCESGPQRLVITVSINQSTNSSKACFFFPLSPSISTFPLVSAFTVRDSLQVCLMTLFIRLSRCLRSRSHLSLCLGFPLFKLPSIMRCEAEMEPRSQIARGKQLVALIDRDRQLESGTHAKLCVQRATQRA